MCAFGRLSKRGPFMKTFVHIIDLYVQALCLSKTLETELIRCFLEVIKM